jgi:adenine-specific DNA-methyltransferase
VDLYHAFAKAMSNVLKLGGTLGLLTSNRFLTIKSGAALRKLLNQEFSLRAVYDLGDTKLFTAAVLPVVVVAKKSREKTARPCTFTRVYEHRGEARIDHDICDKDSLLSAIRKDEVSGFLQSPDYTYRLERGSLLATGNDEVWSLSTPDYQKWLESVSRHRSFLFHDVARIRVGIKTTADDVFIRDEWTSLPADQRPEAELLRPLIRHFDANRWFRRGTHKQTVLYPHTTDGERRAPIDLDNLPNGKRYLESHFERLNRRRYVIEGGRKWYEIWVPHTPSDWARIKIVFPDISEAPKFFLDDSGAVVNGDCYWMTLRDGFTAEMLFLMLAVANSTFITRYYDIAFHNKLYAGRRRFMTQYVKRFPLPSVSTPAAREIIDLVREIVNRRDAPREVEARIDRLVWGTFGLVEESPG